MAALVQAVCWSRGTMRGLLLLSSAIFLTSASLIFVALILLHMYLACTNQSTYEMLKRESCCLPACAPLHLQYSTRAKRGCSCLHCTGLQCCGGMWCKH